MWLGIRHVNSTCFCKHIMTSNRYRMFVWFHRIRWVFEKWAVWRIWVILSFRLYPFMVFECLSVGLGKLSRKLSDLDPFLGGPQLILLSHSEYVAGWTSNSTTAGGSGPSALFAVPGQGKKRSGPPAKPWLRRERTARMKLGGFNASCFLKQLLRGFPYKNHRSISRSRGSLFPIFFRGLYFCASKFQICIPASLRGSAWGIAPNCWFHFIPQDCWFDTPCFMAFMSIFTSGMGVLHLRKRFQRVIWSRCFASEGLYTDGVSGYNCSFFSYSYTDLYSMVVMIRPGKFSFLNTGCSVILVGWHGTFEGWKHLTRFRLLLFVRRRGFRFRVLWTNPTADALQAACERGIGGLRSRGEDENGKLKW